MNKFVLSSQNTNGIVPIGSVQLPSSEFVPFEMAQIPTVLFSTWLD